MKDQLKALKGSWNKTLGGWCFPGSRKDEVMALLREDATNTVEEVEESEPPTKKAKKEVFIDDGDDY